MAVFNIQQCIIEGKARQCKMDILKDLYFCERKHEKCGSRFGKEACGQSPMFPNKPMAEPILVATKADMVLTNGKVAFTAEGKKAVFEQNVVGL